MELLRRLWKDEEGQGMVEYALIIVAIALAVMLVLPGVGTAISNIFTNIKDKLVAPAAAG